MYSFALLAFDKSGLPLCTPIVQKRILAVGASAGDIEFLEAAEKLRSTETETWLVIYQNYGRSARPMFCMLYVAIAAHLDVANRWIRSTRAINITLCEKLLAHAALRKNARFIAAARENRVIATFIDNDYTTELPAADCHPAPERAGIFVVGCQAVTCERGAVVDLRGDSANDILAMTPRLARRRVVMAMLTAHRKSIDEYITTLLRILSPENCNVFFIDANTLEALPASSLFNVVSHIFARSGSPTAREYLVDLICYRPRIKHIFSSKTYFDLVLRQHLVDPSKLEPDVAFCGNGAIASLVAANIPLTSVNGAYLVRAYMASAENKTAALANGYTTDRFVHSLHDHYIALTPPIVAELRTLTIPASSFVRGWFNLLWHDLLIAQRAIITDTDVYNLMDRRILYESTALYAIEYLRNTPVSLVCFHEYIVRCIHNQKFDKMMLCHAFSRLAEPVELTLLVATARRRASSSLPMILEVLLGHGIDGVTVGGNFNNPTVVKQDAT
jgi:hypothetical protein